VLSKLPALPAETRQQLCSLALISRSRDWRCRPHSPQGRGQAFDVPTQALLARTLPFIYFSAPSCHPAFSFFSVVRLCLDVGKMEKFPFPPAQPSWYDPTPQILGKNPPPPRSPSLRPVKQNVCLEVGGFLEHPSFSSSSSSSSSQPISEGCDSPARLARRRSLPAGCRPAACVFHDKLETTRLVAGKCVVDYRRRRQTGCALMPLPARASIAWSPRRGGAWAWCRGPNVLSKTFSLEQGWGREGKRDESWLGTCYPSVIPWLELRVPPSTHGVPRSARGSPSLPGSLLPCRAILQTFRFFFLLAGHCRCSHNTEGPSCERCSPGFYGNPFVGRFDDCKPCPCPDRSPCTEVPGSGEVVCTHCPPGQRGEAGGGRVRGPWAVLARLDPPHLFAFPRKTLRALRRRVFRGPPGAEGPRASLRPLPVSRERGPQRRGELRPRVRPVPALPVQHDGRALREVSAGLLRGRTGS